MKIGKQSDQSQGLFQQQVSIMLNGEHGDIQEYPNISSPPCGSAIQQYSQDNVLTNFCSSQIRFYQQYKKIYTVAYHLYIQKQRQIQLLNNLRDRVSTVQLLFNKTHQKLQQNNDKQSQHELKVDDSKSKRARRTAEQIQKKYKCQVQFCQRFYGSQGSLQQHIKLKHPELYVKNQDEKSQEIF